jgi:hypothetical protein
MRTFTLNHPHMIIQIPIHPANLRYLKERYNFETIFEIHRVTAFDYFLQELLRPKPRSFSKFNPNGYPQLYVRILRKGEYAHLIHLPESFIPLLNQYIKHLIHIEFIAHMEALEGFIDSQSSIYYFINKFGFEESELTFDSLKQYYFRYRQKSRESTKVSNAELSEVSRHIQLNIFSESVTA